MRIASFWKSSLLLLTLAGSLRADPISLTGVVREKGTRTPMRGVNVFVLPAKLKATTDDEGRFTVEGFEGGEFQWVINQSGYLKLERDDSQDADAEDVPERVLLLEKAHYDVYETTVYGKEEKRDARTRSLTPQEFLKAPGSYGDPIKAVQNLPGVARPQGFSSQVIIEGSAPQDTKYMIDGHEVPIIFHFGGLTSVMFPEAIAQVDYLAAGYGPEYGRALGGIVGVRTKSGARDRFHALGFVDLFQAGALVQGPVGGGSYLVGARQSYIGHVLKAFARNNSRFNLSVAPSYLDAIAIYATKLTEATELKIVALTSSDKLEFILDQPVGRTSSGRGTFINETSFYRLIPQLTHRFSDSFLARFSLGVGRDRIRLEVYDDFFRLSNWALTFRGEAETKLAPWAKGFFGLDNRYNWAEVGYRVPNSFSSGGPGGTSSSTSASIQSQVTPAIHEIGVYARTILHDDDSPWTFSPGVRVDYFNTTKEVLPAARVSAQYRWDDSLTLRGALGRYYQGPQGQQIDEKIGNPDLKAPRAWHFTVGAEKDFRGGDAEGFTASSDIFYRIFQDLVVSSRSLVNRGAGLVPERYNNSQSGTAFGLSSYVKYARKPVVAWIAYTLQRSRRDDPIHGEHRFRYDQTHILNVMGAISFGRNWSLGARLRYITGNGYTPLMNGVFDSDNDFFRPTEGVYLSERFPAFVSVDARLDKKWVFDSWVLSAYLDVQNLTNQKNVDTLRYSYDYQKQEPVSFLPILPSLGVKGEF